MKNTNEINRVGNNTTYLNKQITMQIVAASGILEEPVGWVSVFLPRKCSVNETILVNYKRVVRLYCLIWTFPGSQLEKNPLALQETLIWFPSVSVGKESTMLETWVWSLGWEDPLEEDLATHSSILAWRSPLQSWACKESDTTERLNTAQHEHFQVAQWWRIPCRCRRLRFDPRIRKIPWRRKWQPTPGFMPGESQGQRSLEGYSSWGGKASEITEHKHIGAW